MHVGTSGKLKVVHYHYHHHQQQQFLIIGQSEVSRHREGTLVVICSKAAAIPIVNGTFGSHLVLGLF